MTRLPMDSTVVATAFVLATAATIGWVFTHIAVARLLRLGKPLSWNRTVLVYALFVLCGLIGGWP